MESYFFRVPPVVSVAVEVLCGKYGVNEERKKKLEAECVCPLSSVTTLFDNM